jgi:hypothetical protein
LAKYPYLALLVEKFSRTTYGRYSNNVSEYLKTYSVVLLSKDHRKRIKIGGFDTKEEAKLFLLKISEKYSKLPVKYSPQVSERTRSRR